MMTYRPTLRWLLAFSLYVLFMSALPVHADACLDAPPPRFTPGMNGVVAPGVNGLRLRALPVVGAGTVGSLNSGTRFTVISGPSCNGGYNWWRVDVVGAGTGWIAEGDWSQYFIAPETPAPARTLSPRAVFWVRVGLVLLRYASII